MDNNLFFDKYFSQLDIDILSWQVKQQKKIWEVKLWYVLIPIWAFVILIVSTMFDENITIGLFITFIAVWLLYFWRIFWYYEQYIKKVRQNVNISKLQSFFKDFYSFHYPWTNIYQYSDDFSYENWIIKFENLSKKNENIKILISSIFHAGFSTQVLNYSIITQNWKYLYIFDIEKTGQRRNSFPEFYRLFVLSNYEDLENQIWELIPEDKKMKLIYFQTFQKLFLVFFIIFMILVIVAIVIVDQLNQPSYEEYIKLLAMWLAWIPFILLILYKNFQHSLIKILKIPSYKNFLNKNSIDSPLWKITLKKLSYKVDNTYQWLLWNYNYFDKMLFLTNMEIINLNNWKIREILNS